MHTRHSGHRQEIENQSSELGTHFASCGLDNLEVQIIDCVQEGKDMALIQLEAEPFGDIPSPWKHQH